MASGVSLGRPGVVGQAAEQVLIGRTLELASLFSSLVNLRASELYKLRMPFGLGS
jgi:hypothetical protein